MFVRVQKDLQNVCHGWRRNLKLFFKRSFAQPYHYCSMLGLVSLWLQTITDKLLQIRRRYDQFLRLLEIYLLSAVLHQCSTLRQSVISYDHVILETNNLQL